MQMLDWLPSDDALADRIRQARRLGGYRERLEAVAQLANHNRDLVETARLDRLLTQSLAGRPDGDTAPAGFVPLRLAILSSHTTDHLAGAIRVASLARGVLADVHIGPYGSFRSALLGEEPALRAFDPDYVLLALDPQALLPEASLGNPAQAQAHLDAALDELKHLWRQARQRYGARVIQQTLLPLTPPLFGSFDSLLATSPTALCAALNHAIREAAREEGILLLDVDMLLPSRVEDARRVDIVRWHQGKQLINPLFGPLYGDLLARILAALAGRARKALVLDLDNTLWGGVVGDDGLAGIRLGQGSAEGEAYLAFQRHAERLRSAGVILAVCSKNDEAVARAVFDQHPEMVLKNADIGCFIANWVDKATNLRTIARRLGIGTDSLVFVDDNPAERQMVRGELPEVAVPEMPDDVALYPGILSAAGYFETTALTADDLARSTSYAANAQRQALASTTDMDAYLTALEMTMAAGPIGAQDLNRATQLINKTNQFNLTTKRRTLAELEDLVRHPDTLTLCFRLKDRFGDNGLISVIVARPDEALPADELLIDTWLMSCRVLARGVEHAALEAMIGEARRRGVRALVGHYRPSGRNGLVAGHYRALGFGQIAALPGAAGEDSFWRLDTEDGARATHHILLEAA